VKLKPDRWTLAWLVIGYLGVVVLILVSLRHVPLFAPIWPGADKLVHGLAYLTLMMWFGQLPRTSWVAYAAMLFSLGGIVELLQGLGGYRQAEWLDWVADGVGIAIASALLLRGHCTGLQRLSRRYSPATAVGL